MYKLFEHQAKSLRFFRARDVGADFSDPGTGKTLTQIALYDQTGDGRMLVICPRSLQVTAWEHDFNRFAPHIKTQVIQGPKSKREKALKASADVFIVNTDGTRWLRDQTAFLKDFDRIVVDESSTFKNLQAQRTKALMKLSQHVNRRYIMSGTPTPNTITELYSQIFFLDHGYRLGPSFYRFQAQTTSCHQTGPHPTMKKYVDLPGIQDVVMSLISDITIRHRLDDCLSLPEHTENLMTFRMKPKTIEQYLQFKKNSILTLPDKSITAVNAAVLLNKLAQVASGAVYAEDGSYEVLDDERIELACDLVEARESCVVFFNWTHQRDEMIKALKKRRISHVVVDGSKSDAERVRAVQMFEAGMAKVFLCHPQTASHGLTLVRGTTTLYLSPTFNLEHYEQGKRRIFRAGQTRRTETIVLLAEGTCDQMIHNRMSDKRSRLNLLMEIARAA